jgi:energy-coupling factor transporter transmembrane protein EcfT
MFLLKKIPPLRFSKNFTLFLSFIPQVFETYRQINLAWHARSGKHGFRKIRVLVFVLISISLDKASKKAAALAARKTQK